MTTVLRKASLLVDWRWGSGREELHGRSRDALAPWWRLRLRLAPTGKSESKRRVDSLGDYLIDDEPVGFN